VIDKQYKFTKIELQSTSFCPPGVAMMNSKMSDVNEDFDFVTSTFDVLH